MKNPELHGYKFLGFFAISYCILYIISNWYDSRLIYLFGLTSGAGVLIFPLTFLLLDIITEIYGYKHARRAIWIGFLFNLLFILFTYFVAFIDSANTNIQAHSFDRVVASDNRLIIASALTYLCSEPLSSFLIAKLKVKMQGRNIGIRFILSTFLASGIDTFVFCLLGFYGTMDNAHLVDFVLSSWLIKITIEVIGLPFAIRLVKVIKRKEKLDIYDTETDFNLLQLDATYQKKDNLYAESHALT